MRASCVAILVLAAYAVAPALSSPVVYVVAPRSLAIPANLLVTFAAPPMCTPPLTLFPAMPPPLLPHCTDAMSTMIWVPAGSFLSSIPPSDSPASSSAVTLGRVPWGLLERAPTYLSLSPLASPSDSPAISSAVTM